jgi:predicted RNA-binding Zn-ribbon protein involved in translation (DUF1610 family)
MREPTAADRCRACGDPIDPRNYVTTHSCPNCPPGFLCLPCDDERLPHGSADAHPVFDYRNAAGGGTRC